MAGAWLLVISGMATLLIAANSKTKEHVCREILVGIKGNEGKFYVEKEDVLRLMEKTMSGSLLQKAVTAINLARLEAGLKTNPWIKDAQLYFDSKDALHVFVEEREPVARVFTTEGNSFYMDSSGSRMPLLDKMSIRVPVITGFTSAKKFNAADSVLLNQVKQVASFVFSNEFWNEQVGQIDITPERKFELVPVIGDHVIRLGTGEDVEDKLNRLYVFYRQVMSKAGFDRYAALDLQYRGQVVAVKKQATSPVDSIQLEKNIEALMNRASMQNVDEDMLPDQNLTSIKADSIVNKAGSPMNTVSTKTNSNPMAVDKASQNTAKKKTETKSIPKKSKAEEKPGQAVRESNLKPKAVMPKKAR